MQPEPAPDETVLTNLANQVVARLELPATAVDPSEILDLVIVVMKLVVLVFGCLAVVSPKTARRINSPGLLARVKLHWMLRKVLTKEGYGNYVDQVYENLLTVGRGLTVDDLQKVLTEVAADPLIYSKAVSYQLI